MPCYTRMKAIYLRGLLWLYLLGVGYVVVSLEPGFLDFDNLPDTNFSCVGKVIGGYYADLETNCQMFHVCTIGQLDEPMDIRFLCLNGTVFDQETRVCERIDEVDCSKSEQFYSLNLELYGNTQPSVFEDTAESDPPIIIKASTTTTTTTTTTTQRPKTKTTKTAYFTTGTPTVTTVTKVISSHHFPISSGPDIRFNPEEINISLGSVPSVRTKSVAYQQQVFANSNDNNKKVVVTTHTSYGTPEKEDFVRIVPNTQRPQVSSTQKLKAQSPATPADINYGFTYHQTENSNHEYHTELPQHNYQYHHSNIPGLRHGQFRNQFKTTTYRTDPTTRKHQYVHKEPTTYRTPFVSSLKTQAYHTYRTEKPQRLQLPLPLLPTLPPLTFSSPAPFTLGHHIEAKRYTHDHLAPPRIIISASASVSDNSGRRLNYSLGTIGVTPLLEEPPKSYDEYKDHDVVLDPFYHDVPKIKTKRRKREVKPPDLKDDRAAADVLKFLFEWYNSQQKSSVKVPIDPEDITEINAQLAAIAEAPVTENKHENEEREFNARDSALFKKRSKFNIVGDVLSVTEAPEPVMSTVKSTPITVSKLDTVDYVDDNYEAVNNTKEKKEKCEDEKKIVTTEKVTTEMTTVTETTVPPTTTTTEPTTTSRIMGILRKRARVHQKRIVEENRKRYHASLNALKPKIRSTTNKARRVESTTTTSTPAPTTEAKRKFSRKRKTTSVTEKTTSTTTRKRKKPLVTEKTTSTTTQAPKPEKSVLPELTTVPEKEKTTIAPEQLQGATELTTIHAEEQIHDDNAQSHSEETASIIVMPQAQEEKVTEKEEPQVGQVSEELTAETEAVMPQAQDEKITEKEELTPETKTNEEKEDSIHDQLEQESIVGDDVELSTVSHHDVEPTTLKEESQVVEASEKSSQTDKETGNLDLDYNTKDAFEEMTTEKSDKRDLEDYPEDSYKEVAEDRLIESDYEDERLEDSVKETTTIIFEESQNEATTLKEESQVVDVNQVEEGRSRGRFHNYEDHSETTSPNDVTSEEPKKEDEDTEEALETSTPQDEERVEYEDAVLSQPEIEAIVETTTELVYHVSDKNEEENIVPTDTPEKRTSTVPTTEAEHGTEEDKTETTLVVSTTESYDDGTTLNDDAYQTVATESTTAEVQSTTEAETATNLTPAETTTTETSSVSRGHRRTRPPRTKTSSSYRRPNPRHRFSTELTSRPSRRKPAVEDEIIEALTSQLTTTESLTREEIDSTSAKISTTTIVDYSEDIPATDAPLFKSANPTQAESAKESLHTTPLSMVYKLHVRKEKLKSYIFNCFGKAINRFYSDPRDCRLFHYCTSGYTKNQLLDMKFVCDLGTYFDDEKLICTKVKPERCL